MFAKPSLGFNLGGEHTGKGRWAGLCKKVRNMVATNWTHQTRMSHSGDAGTLESIGKSRSRLVNPFPINLHQWVVVTAAVLVVRVHREPSTGMPTSVYSGIYISYERACGDCGWAECVGTSSIPVECKWPVCNAPCAPCTRYRWDEVCVCVCVRRLGCKQLMIGTYRSTGPSMAQLLPNGS